MAITDTINEKVQHEQNHGVVVSKIRETLLEMVSDSLITTTVELSSAEILALHTTPVTLLPAVAGSVIQVASALLIHDFGGTAYIAGGDLRIQDKGTATNVVADTASTLLTTALDTIYSADAQGSSYPILQNSLIEITAGGQFVSGNGTLRIVLTYKVLPTGL